MLSTFLFKKFGVLVAIITLIPFLYYFIICELELAVSVIQA